MITEPILRFVRRCSTAALVDFFDMWRQSWRADVRRLRNDHLELRLRLQRIEEQLASLARPSAKLTPRPDRKVVSKVPLVLESVDRQRAEGADVVAGPDAMPVIVSTSPVQSEAARGNEILELERCAVCGGVAWTDVCEFNKLFLLERGPDQAAKLSRYAMCHDCGIVFARRRPTGRRFTDLLEQFEANLGRVAVGKRLQGRLWLNSARLDAEAKAALRQSLAAGVFVSEHQSVDRSRHLPALLRDRMSCAAHIEILTSLLNLERPRVLELRPRFGAIGAGLIRVWGGEVYGLPLFEGQQLIAQEVYGLRADHLLDFDRFLIPYEGTFSLIVSNHVFTHAVRPNELLTTLRDRIAPGGHLYLYNEDLDNEFLDHHESMFKVLNPFHFQAFDRDSLLRGLRKFGFEPVFVSQDRVLARRLDDVPDFVPLTDTERVTRLGRYRAARDLAILRVPPHLRSVFAAEWEEIVARAHAEHLAELTPGGKLRILRGRGTRDQAEGDTPTLWVE